MIENKLTYISLFSSSGVGCFGFKQENYICIATNELIQRRLSIQKFNNKCDRETGYICGDIKDKKIKEKIFQEIEYYKQKGNDSVDVLIATPPCQGMSVANHKKKKNEIDRNSLVVESIKLTEKIRPKFFVFENVQSFLSTGCTAPNGKIKTINTVIFEELSKYYQISSRVLNFKNYGNNSSRTRTLVIGVRHDYSDYISPLELFPDYSGEKKLREVIGDLKPLRWGEIDNDDILHAFRTYSIEMKQWISCLKEGESAFDNKRKQNRPHRIIKRKFIENVNKNADKYRRQTWNKVGPCIHTRNDQLASQNTIHPREDRVFSIRELMLMMSIPKNFKWSDISYRKLNNMNIEDKKLFYKNNEINIRQSIGEAVPTEVFRQIAHKIKTNLLANHFKIDIENIIKKNKLKNSKNLQNFIIKNPKNYSSTILSKIAEMSNEKRLENDAYYTNKTLLTSIVPELPDFYKDEISILEPSVGVGNFLPFIFIKYENYKKVNLDVMDIDDNSILILKTLLQKYKVPKNIKIRYINDDFLKHSFRKKYDLIIGNPPFTKVYVDDKTYKFDFIYNTNNLCAYFLEKAISIATYVCMIQPKYILNTAEFSTMRNMLSKYRIDTILDFGEKGFKGVKIETVCLFINTYLKPSKTYIMNATFNVSNLLSQREYTSSKYPYWLLYRNKTFSQIERKMTFGCFDVFRDRQISNKELTSNKNKNNIRVLKSRNISSDGKIININNYDAYIPLNKLKKKAVYKFYNNENVYLVPNMTYYPRMIRNPKNITVNGSVAVLIPKVKKLTAKQMKYFSSNEFRYFYFIARNLQPRSLNIDETSVYFFGVLKER